MRSRSFNKGLKFDFKSALKLTNKITEERPNYRTERPLNSVDPKDSYSIHVNDGEPNMHQKNVSH